MRSNEPKESKVNFDLSAVDVSDEQFGKMVETTTKMVEELGLNHKTMMPTLIVHHRRFQPDGMPTDMEATLVGIGVDFSDAKEKRQILRNIGRKFFEEQDIPCAVFLSSEAWLSFNAKACIDGGMMPSQDPNKKEALTMVGRTMSGDCKVGVFITVKRGDDELMVRDGENVVTKNSELDTFLLDQFYHGYFEPLLKKFTPEELKDMAKKHGGSRL